MGRLHLPEEDEDEEARRPKRRPIPNHVPRMEVEIAPGEDACARCGGRLRRIGEDGEPWSAIGPRTMASEELECVPGRFVVNRIARPRLTCSGELGASCRRHCPHAPSSGVGRGPGCWPTCWCPSTKTTFPCTARARSTPATGSIWTAPPWRTGWGARRRSWSHSPPPSGATRSAARPSSRTTRRWPCSPLAREGPPRRGCGSTCATSGPGADRHPPRRGTSSPPTGRASTRRAI